MPPPEDVERIVQTLGAIGTLGTDHWGLKELSRTVLLATHESS